MSFSTQQAGEHVSTSQARSSASIVDTSRSHYARLRPVPLSALNLDDEFWAPRRRINRTLTLPSQYRHCEETGRIDNFRRAAGKKDIPFQGIYFNDSDVYKWLEAAAWTLATDDDPALARMVDAVIAEIADAQQPDGYLNTYFMFDKAAERWSNLRDMHELYCAGHLIQAAIAHHRATGSDRLLAVACRLADHICDAFGPEEEGKQPGADGHEEIEMALVELARETREARYRHQAQYFLDVRGRGLVGGKPYHQDHQPFRELDRVTGHAVRAVYLNAGATDIYAETGEPALRHALDRLWNNMTTRQMYVSGGIGSRYDGEAFGKDHELPNERAYTETCAAIGSVMWNWRMLALNGDARYADILETTLYNAVLCGLSHDGQSYFYQNPLADDGTHRRQAWFGCACCPPNVARLLASLPGYFYSLSEDDNIWVHLYAQGSSRIELVDGRIVALRQQTRYPWNGEVTVEVRSEGTFGLLLRLPGWCEAGLELEINGRPFAGDLAAGTYAEIRRTWRTGDTVRLKLPMPVRRIECHPYAIENVDRAALMRGPLLYCIEQADNDGCDLRDLVLPAGAELSSVFQPELLDGVVALHGRAEVEAPDEGWRDRLYRTVPVGRASPSRQQATVTAIPYYAWANREQGAMQVWLRTK